MRATLACVSVAGALIAAAGCAARPPQTYRLVRDVLVPPGVAKPGVSRRVFTVDIPLGRRSCTDGQVAIDIRRRGHNARVTVNREALVGHPPGWLTQWAAALESEDCIAPGAGLTLARRISESLPLDLFAGFCLLHANDRQLSYLEIGPENRLQVDSPILREGAPASESSIESIEPAGAAALTVTVKAAPGLLGYETAWYTVRPKASEHGFMIVPLFAEAHIQGAVERSPNPRVNYFRFPPDASFYRLFYRGDRTIIVVSAPTRAELDHRTQALKQNPEACASCVMFPNNVGVNVNIVATVNGREIALPVGSRLASAMRAAGESHPEALLPRLLVRKSYDGRLVPVEFDRGDAAILSLVLLGGEEISW